MKKIIVGLTGASGSIFFKKLIEELVINEQEIYVIATSNGEKVFEFEIKQNFNSYIQSLNYEHLHLCDINDMFNKIASGSFFIDGMVILPSSMGTIGRIASGTSDNLLIRSGDVQLKEKRKLIIAFREAPLSGIHLNNMLTLANAGAIIYPTVPAFYLFPKSIDDIISQVIGRILNYLDIDSNLTKNWNGN